MAKLAVQQSTFLLILLLAATPGFGQYDVRYVTEAGESSLPQVQTTFSSRDAAQLYLNKFPSLLRVKGFLAASVDSVQYGSGSATAFVFVGKRYNWTSIKLRNPSGEHSFEVRNRTLSPEEIEGYLEQILVDYENAGYPFARIRLDSVDINGSDIAAMVEIDKGVFYRIDSIRLHGNARLSPDFLEKHLSIKKGMPYNADVITQIDAKLSRLSFVEQQTPYTVEMYNSGAVINLFLKNRPVNQVNALLGFLPANQQLGGKLLLTGEALLNLTNSFGAAENISLQWQQLQPKSPRLKLGYNQPYFLGLGLGIDLNFELFKKDSAFLNVSGNVGATFQVKQNQWLKLSLQMFSSRLLEIDTAAIKMSQRLPEMLDLSSLLFGTEYKYINTNYWNNPISGWEATVAASGGSKTIKRNNIISQLKLPGGSLNALYDSLQLKGYLVRLAANVTRYNKVGKQATVKLQLQTGWIFSNTYLRNELFQIGGYKILRGFDEESIFANNYGVATVEYRYLLQRNSYFSVFSDVATSALHTSFSNARNYFVSGGLGLSLETKGGIFNIAYAVGKRSETKFDLRQSKIHIGFAAVF